MRASRVVLTVSLLLAALMVVVPPWKVHDPMTGRDRFHSYAPLWDGPKSGEVASTIREIADEVGLGGSLPGYELDGVRLLLQLVALAGLTGAALVALRSR